MSEMDFGDIEEAFPLGDLEKEEKPILDNDFENDFKDESRDNSLGNFDINDEKEKSVKEEKKSVKERSIVGGEQSFASNAGSKQGGIDAKLKRYLNNLSEYDKSRYLQLAEKNKKLRKELKGIAQATEEIILKEKERKKRKYHHKEDEEVKKKNMKLREQQGVLNQLKKKIASKKRELDTAYQYPLIREKEDELRNLKRILRELESERDSVLKVKRQQSKALKALKYNKEEEGRKAQLAQELNRIKKENKELSEKKLQLEKIMNKNHVKIVNGKVYIRELKKRLSEFKKRHDGTDYKNIEQKHVDELKEKIVTLKEEKKKIEQRHFQDLKNIEKMKHELRQENIRLDKLLSEKDKEMRLNSIKMKELKRLQRHRALKPVKEKVDLGMNRPRSNGMRDKGLDGPGLNDEEFEFVDDRHDDTNINISQEDQEDSRKSGEGNSAHGEEGDQRQDQNGEGDENQRENEDDRGKRESDNEDQNSLDNRGEDDNDRGLELPNENPALITDPFGSNNPKSEEEEPEEEEKPEEEDPFGGGQDEDDNAFGLGTEDRAPKKGNDDVFGFGDTDPKPEKKEEEELHLDFDDF